MELTILTLSVLSILCFALRDSIYDNGKKEESKKYKHIAIGMLLIAGYLSRHFTFDLHLRFIAAYPFLWFSIFDITYNLTRNPPLPINYIGTTSGLYGKIRHKIQGLYPLLVLMSLIFAISLFYMKGSLI